MNFNNLIPGNYTGIVNSKGIVDEFSFTINSAINLIADFNLNKDTVYLSEGGEINIFNNSQNAQNYEWDFGDGGSCFDVNPTYTYSTLGDFDITLSANNSNCFSEKIKQITVLQSPNLSTSIKNIDSEKLQLANLGNGNYQIMLDEKSKNKILVYDISGKIIYESVINTIDVNISLTNFSSGIYIVNIFNENGIEFQGKVYR